MQPGILRLDVTFQPLRSDPVSLAFTANASGELALTRQEGNADSLDLFSAGLTVFSAAREQSMKENLVNQRLPLMIGIVVIGLTTLNLVMTSKGLSLIVGSGPNLDPEQLQSLIDQLVELKSHL